MKRQLPIFLLLLLLPLRVLGQAVEVIQIPNLPSFGSGSGISTNDRMIIYDISAATGTKTRNMSMNQMAIAMQVLGVGSTSNSISAVLATQIVDQAILNSNLVSWITASNLSYFVANQQLIASNLTFYQQGSNAAFNLRSLMVFTNQPPSYSVTNLNQITYVLNTNYGTGSGTGEVTTAQLLVVSNQVQATSNSLQTQISAIGTNSGLTASQLTASNQWLSVWRGDSRIALSGLPGSGSPLQRAFGLTNFIGSRTLIDAAYSGNTLETEATHTTNLADFYIQRSSLTPGEILDFLGINDAGNNRTFSQMTNWQAIIALRSRTNGAKAYIKATVPYGTNFLTTAQATVLTNFNNWITNNAAGYFDQVVDLNLLTNTFSDGLHEDIATAYRWATNLSALLPVRVFNDAGVSHNGMVQITSRQPGYPGLFLNETTMRINNESTTPGRIEFWSSDTVRPSQGIRHYKNGDDNLALFTYEVDRLYINTVGYIGIGTTNPWTMVDITGGLAANSGDFTNGLTGILRGKSGSIITNMSLVVGMYLDGNAAIFGRNPANGAVTFSIGDETGITGAATGDMTFRADTNKFNVSVGTNGTANFTVASNEARFLMPVNLAAGATIRGLTSQQLTNRALIIGAGDSEQALYYAVDSTATMSPLNFPYWLPSMETWAGKFDYVPMAVPGQTLVTISNNLESVYVPLVQAATNRVRYFFAQGGYNDKSGGATDTQVTNTIAGISARMRSLGVKVVAFDIVNYKTTANAVSNLAVNGVIDHFIPFAGAESHLMADAIHLKPFGSLLWARSLTNTIPLTVSPEPARIGEVSLASTNITSPFVTAKSINFSGFTHIPPPTSPNATNMIRPYVEAFEGGIWAWNTNQYDFGGYRTYYGKEFIPSVHLGLGRDSQGLPLSVETPGTNWLLARLIGTNNGFGIADVSGLVKFGVTWDGNIPMRGAPIFYNTQNFSDGSSNVVAQFARGSNVSSLITSPASWGYRILGDTNNWVVANNAGSAGIAVDGNTGKLTASGGVAATLPGSGEFVGIDGSGNMFKTNAPSGGGGSSNFVVSSHGNLSLTNALTPQATNTSIGTSASFIQKLFSRSLYVNVRINARETATTIGDDDTVVFLNRSSITMPLAASYPGRVIILGAWDSGANCTVNRSGSDLFYSTAGDGNSAFTLLEKNAAIFISDGGSRWLVME